MNDAEYIREGVELAGGFWINHDSIYLSGEADMRNWLCALDSPRRYVIDAIAAQLERQVEQAGYDFVVRCGHAVIREKPNYSKVVGVQRGPDRTMNTIRAIIDSKVLEQ